MSLTREYKCKDSNGGNTEVYLMPYVNTPRSSIVTDGNYVTDFPTQIIYKVDTLSAQFTEKVSQEDGGLAHEQTVNFKMSKIMPTDFPSALVERDFRIIIKDNNGFYRFVGLKTGLLGSYTEDTGANRNEFNGYDFTYTTKEEQRAYFLEDLSLFEINVDIITADNTNITVDITTLTI